MHECPTIGLLMSILLSFFGTIVFCTVFSGILCVILYVLNKFNLIFIQDNTIFIRTKSELSLLNDIERTEEHNKNEFENNEIELVEIKSDLLENKNDTKN